MNTEELVFMIPAGEAAMAEVFTVPMVPMAVLIRLIVLPSIFIKTSNRELRLLYTKFCRD